MINSNLTDDTFSNELLKYTSMLKAFSQEDREYLLGIAEGKYLAPLTSDAMSKKLFSPDTEPERFNNIMQRVMKDPTIKSEHSAANEIPIESKNAKKCITDMASWLSDKRFAALEIQQIAQEFSYNRYDIYTSRLLLLQYTVDEGQKKSELDYENINGVVLVVLMRKSPDFLKDRNNPRYIHRFTNAISDSGIKIPLLKKIAFVQLDKALEQFLSNTYNEDEDYELLVELAMLADANNPKVREIAEQREQLRGIYRDAAEFLSSKEVQLMTFKEELNLYDMEYTLRKKEEHGIEKGEKNGITKLNNLYSWLFDNNRAGDVKRASKDSEYLEQLLEEYENLQDVEAIK